MATYTITNNEHVAWDDVNHFKYRYRSTDGFPTAQSEFERKRAAGEFAILWKWERGDALAEGHNHMGPAAR